MHAPTLPEKAALIFCDCLLSKHRRPRAREFGIVELYDHELWLVLMDDLARERLPLCFVRHTVILISMQWVLGHHCPEGTHYDAHIAILLFLYRASQMEELCPT